jgi:hypothetical protein
MKNKLPIFYNGSSLLVSAKVADKPARDYYSIKAIREKNKSGLPPEFKFYNFYIAQWFTTEPKLIKYDLYVKNFLQDLSGKNLTEKDLAINPKTIVLGREKVINKIEYLNLIMLVDNADANILEQIISTWLI